jgi:hypothetical protein
MPLDLTATLADLISIPSVNPMGFERRFSLYQRR